MVIYRGWCFLAWYMFKVVCKPPYPTTKLIRQVAKFLKLLLLPHRTTTQFGGT